MEFIARHFKKLQDDGVCVWDGRLNKMRTVRVALLFSSNDIRAYVTYSKFIDIYLPIGSRRSTSRGKLQLSLVHARTAQFGVSV